MFEFLGELVTIRFRSILKILKYKSREVYVMNRFPLTGLVLLIFIIVFKPSLFALTQMGRVYYT